MSKFLKIFCFLVIGFSIMSFSMPVFASSNCDMSDCNMSDCKKEGHKHSAENKDEKSKKALYVCPDDKCTYHKKSAGKCKMHGKKLVESEVVFKCPKCGMNFDKPGKCSMDGEKLVPEIVKPKVK